MVIEIKDLTVGLIVDNVDLVITIPNALIVSPPKLQNRYIKGIGLER